MTKLWRTLLRLLPGNFRTRHDDDLIDLYDDELRARGLWAGLGFAAGSIIDLLRGAAGLRWRRPRSSSPGWRMESWLADVRYAVRGMVKHPAFTVVAAGSLMLGIGLNTAVFTVVDAMLFRPMPVEDPSSLAAVFTSQNHGEPNGTTSWADFVDLRESSTVFNEVVGYSMMMGAFGSAGDNRLILGEVVTANYFSALGVAPALGRGFRPDEEIGERAHPVTVLSHRLWQRLFAGRPDVLGKTIILHNRPYTIIGVAPAGFPGLIPGLASELWIPVTMTADVEPIALNDVEPSPGNTRLERRGHRWLSVLGRLRPDASLPAAEASLNATMARLAAVYPDSNGDRRARVMPASDVRIHPLLDGTLRGGGLVLLAAVSLVLLVACANLSSMLLARGVSRARELALRSALGASRRRLVRQMLVENVVLALAGGGAGVLLAGWLLQWLAAIETPFQLAIPLGFTIDTRVLAFALALSIVTGVLAGLVPAIRASRTNLVSGLTAEAVPVGRARRRLGLGHGLVVVQIAVSLMLVVGGTLLARSLWTARDIDPGFDPAPIALASINLGFHGYGSEDAAQFFDRAVDRMRQLPGVTAVGLSERMPFSPNVHVTTVVLDGQPDATPPGGASLDTTRVSPGYFEAMGIPILEGRSFDARDTPDATRVAIINQTLAARYWPARSAVGQRFRLGDESGRLVEIVGIVADHKVRTLGEAPRGFIHFARSQSDAPWGTFVVRAEGRVEPTVLAMRRELLALDPNVVLMESQPFASLIASSLLPVRLGATLIGGLAALAMVLAGLGLYGVVAFGVSRRTREIGIRMALGASRGRVIGQVLREALVVVAAGGVFGFGLAALGARALAGVLHVGSLDPLSYLGAGACLAIVGGVAALVPARRAATLDPLRALRT